MAKDRHKIFEQLMTDMLSSERTVEDLDTCMSFNQEAIRTLSLRSRLLALAFVKRMSLEELNEKLQENGCPRLYSRNFLEATLIYAFQNGIPYEEWKDIYAECREYYENKAPDRYFPDKKITYGELERYVTENSVNEGDLLGTRMVTKDMEEELGRLSDLTSLKDFLQRNILAFSEVREKARYYFCKYLFYYLQTRMEKYFSACRKGRDIDAALSDLMALKAVTALRRNKTMPEEEKRALIRNSAISSGELFDEFSYFYFDYISMDWIDILMEYYGDVSQFPDSQKRSLAEIFRKDRPSLQALSDDEVMQELSREMQEKEDRLQKDYSLDGKNRGYQKNRAGEHAVYRYIKGQLDLDRTTFICFLLFFVSSTDLPDEHVLTSARLNQILAKSGFSTLSPDDDFDGFVDEFLNSREPLDLLMDEIVSYAKLHENSFLYHIYGRSVNYAQELYQPLFG